jgi:ATP-dependent Lon protease
MKKTKNISKKNCQKMRRMNPQAPDFGIQRNYFRAFLELPGMNIQKIILT